MSDARQNNRMPASLMAVALLALATVACSKGEQPPRAVREAAAQTRGAAPKTFASPEDAGTALFNAARSDDQSALQSIFGPEGKDVLSTGDPVKDKENLRTFTAAYGEMHRWGALKAGGQVLYIGANNYVFPVPLDQNAEGKWSFDTAAGKDEILAREIGRNELAAIAAAEAIVNAQQQYISQTHDGEKGRQYAQRLVSDPGSENGLYWPPAAGRPESPLGHLGEFAKSVGYVNAGESPRPFNGYTFTILTKQGNTARGGARDYVVKGLLTGGFGVIAYPAEYRNSGLMTFMVGSDGIVYQKDLGEGTSARAPNITTYDPGDGWTRVYPLSTTPGSKAQDAAGTSGPRR